MNRRDFLTASIALPALVAPGAQAMVGPAASIAPAPEGYSGPWRVWGLRGSRDAGTEQWVSEIASTRNGPFAYLDRPLIDEWWNGAEWVALD